MAQRPTFGRTASTNLSSGGGGHRVLEGKIAIVTGASRGIGAAICTNLASKGCSLVMNYTSDSSSASTESLAESLRAAHGVSAIAVQADMGTEGGPAYVVAAARSAFRHPKTGRFQLDILVNNAGVSRNKFIADTDAEDFAWQYNVNVRGPLFLVRAALPYLPHDRSGRIVNLSSVSASLGLLAQSVYGGTKAALEAMTRTWARELAERATVNAVNPGPVATDMYAGTADFFVKQMAGFLQKTPLAAAREEVDGKAMVERAEKRGGREAYDHEIAGVVAMLCLPEAGWSTGSVVCANGGMKFSY